MAKNYKARKIIKLIIWIVILLGVVFGIFFVVKNKDALWNKVKNNTTIYTQQQLDDEKDKAYNQGYNDAHKNNAELQKQVEEYLKTIAEQEATVKENDKTINQNNTTIVGLETELEKAQEKYITDTTNLQNQITIIAQEKADLQEQVNTIPGLQGQIINLSSQIEELEQELANTSQSYETIKENLQNQIKNLTAINTQLETDNLNNLVIIAELNGRVSDLQEQITTLTQQMLENVTKVEECESEHSALQTSIEYYEQFIASLETETQAVAIFESNGAVHKAQIVQKGNCANANNPANTDTRVFTGWYVNNELVNINTYPITTTTKFVAKFDIAYNVKFMLDNGTEFTTIKVAKGTTPAELESLPTKPGYELIGFTINGVDIIDYTTYTITKDTTFIAKFSKLHSVTFMSGCEIIATQEVKNGEYAKAPINYSNQWLLNGELIDITNYSIYADITFSEYGIITTVQEVNVGMSNENLNPLYIWNFKGDTYYSYYNKQYKFDKTTKKFELKVWSGNIPSDGSKVWEKDGKLYYSNGTIQYEYNNETDTWVNKIWGSTYQYFETYGFNGNNVLKQNGNYFYIDKSMGHYTYCELYKLNKETDTWEGQNLDNTQKYNFYNIEAGKVWYYNDTLYYSMASTQKVINLETKTIENKEWQGFIPSAGHCIVNYGNKVYSIDGNGYYKLNNTTGIFEEITIDSTVELSGDRIWTDGVNYYFTFGKTYILN